MVKDINNKDVKSNERYIIKTKLKKLLQKKADNDALIASDD